MLVEDCMEDTSNDWCDGDGQAEVGGHDGKMVEVSMRGPREWQRGQSIW